ncbi:MAG: hypothetical protein GTO61_12020, partial [Gemmatimonadales bacterium]|nr:hypothetical protein [Gemmatimonadales bacterium]
EWMRAIADAPLTLKETERRTPGVQALVDALRNELEPFKDWYEFRLDRSLLNRYALWESLGGQSTYARIFGVRQITSDNDPVFDVFDRIASDEAHAAAWPALLAHVRKL